MQCTTAAWTITGRRVGLVSLMAARLLQTWEYRDEEFFLEDETLRMESEARKKRMKEQRQDLMMTGSENNEPAALMNFVPMEMPFLLLEVSQKDLVSCFLVLGFDSCSGF